MGEAAEEYLLMLQTTIDINVMRGNDIKLVITDPFVRLLIRHGGQGFSVT